MSINIESMKEQEIKEVAEIASQSFSGLADLERAFQWITCNFKAFPRMCYFVAKEKGKVIGYVLWVEKGGFRQEAVLELEQIAVSHKERGRGVASELIRQSLQQMQVFLAQRGAKLKLIEVTTGANNEAQELYKKTFGAECVAVLKDFFRGNEVIMLARFHP